MNTTKKIVKIVNDDIDKRIQEAEKAGVAAIDRTMIDKLLRNWCIALEMNRVSESDPDEFLDATFWIMAVISVEAILNTTDQQQIDQVYAKMNQHLQSMGKQVTELLSASVQQRPAKGH